MANVSKIEVTDHRWSGVWLYVYESGSQTAVVERQIARTTDDGDADAPSMRRTRRQTRQDIPAVDMSEDDYRAAVLKAAAEFDLSISPEEIEVGPSWAEWPASA